METIQFRYSECWIWPGSSSVDQGLNRALRRINWRLLLAAAAVILYVVVMVLLAGGEATENLLDGVIRCFLIPAFILTVTLYERRRGMAESGNRYSFSHAKKERFRTGSMILKEDSVCLMLEEKKIEIFYRDIMKLDCRRLERGWRRGEKIHHFLEVWSETDDSLGKELSSSVVFEGYQMRIYYEEEKELFVTSREILGGDGDFYDSLYLAYAALKGKL